ncbi:hypothetical protein ACG2LH_12685 [Zhouia sp. PK063]|uniref:hypothetical protein n=1 Tax=Zhouia sp. PK063 TaxID=3373602 RepID=UPI0037919556
MFKYCIAFTAFLVLTSCFNQEHDCKKFKTGTFEFTYTLNGKEQKETFVRNDTMEIDYFGNQIDTNTVRWVSDCEFIVQKLHPKSRAEKKAVRMKILVTKDSTYTFEYNIVGDKQNVQKGIATKIK